MNWFSFLEKDMPLSVYYDAPPSLEKVVIHEVEIHCDGPALRLRFDLSEFVDHPAAKWDKSCNTLQVLLAFYGIHNLHIDGWTSDGQASICLESERDEIVVLIRSPDCNISFRADFLLLETVSAY